MVLRILLARLSRCHRYLPLRRCRRESVPRKTEARTVQPRGHQHAQSSSSLLRWSVSRPPTAKRGSRVVSRAVLKASDAGATSGAPALAGSSARTRHLRFHDHSATALPGSHCSASTTYIETLRARHLILTATRRLITLAYTS